ncbi:HlyD family secretion protein [Xanthomonas sp. XNM01]|uniref:HlyD family secretion protein n=1 Tax=Xanthomonas sp. XNM01 TaxID=2769289 RepID=UPI001785E05D|nr:HlyD family secretion protein [Xanthomonas sp. XNM01]MBD9367082.1 HlyD family secretion protein [Xanthomonas sp. XNM01]
MTSTSGSAAPAAASSPVRKRRVPVWLWVAGPLAVVGFFGWEWVQSSRVVGTDNAYIKAERILVAPQVGGRVVEVAVGQNQPVKQGDLLFRIDAQPLEIAVAQNEALVARMINTASASRAKVTGTGTSIAAANEKLAWSRRDLKRMQELAGQQLVSRQMLDDARHAVAEAESERASAVASQTEAMASLSGSIGTPVEQLPEYRAALAMLEKARLDLAHAEVRAPVDGIVGMHDLQVGEYINLGQTAMPLVATGTWIEANFKETELTRMQVGQTATLRVDSYPGVTWKAHVASIAPASGAEFSVLPAQNATGNWVKIVQRIPVRLEIDDADRADAPILRAGMSAEVKVDLRDGSAATADTATAHG